MYISSKMPKLLILTILFFFKLNLVFSEVVNDIQVKGNNRVSEKTIINFSDLKKGDNTTKKILNESLKKLYDTNFFELVEFKLENNILVIQVLEYPVVQEIIINGIKAQKNIKKMKENMSLKEKNPFIESTVKKDLNQMLNIFKQSGYYFVKIDTKIEKNSNDTVNIVYDVDPAVKASQERQDRDSRLDDERAERAAMLAVQNQPVDPCPEGYRLDPMSKVCVPTDDTTTDTAPGTGRVYETMTKPQENYTAATNFNVPGINLPDIFTGN